MKSWIKVLSWYTIVLMGLNTIALVFMGGKMVEYSSGLVAWSLLLYLPTIALAILALVFLRKGQ